MSAVPDNGQRLIQLAAFWHEEVKRSEKSFSSWMDRGRKIIDRYRDERGTGSNLKRKFNILWSNTQVLKPALYGRMPKPEVSRRYNDADPIARLASTIGERTLEYEVEQYPDFNQAMNGSVEDRLLPGRGVAWIRYEPHIKQEEQVSEDVDASLESLQYECAPCDYVNWQDFLHNPARTWDEVWWVARRVYLSREEGVKRFGEIFNSVGLESKGSGSTGTGTTTADDKETPKDALRDKAVVWEIWDKNDKTVIWIAKGFSQALDEKPDPLQLECFFPCPKPLYATLTTGSLIPVPDYCEYQDQAEELDSITQRIASLTKSCKLVGVYNAEYKNIKRMLNEGVDSDLIPVDSWAAFAEKGGMKGAVDWLPLEMVVKVLEQLYVAREQTLNVIYQTMGLSDIMRGSTKATETLGAQELKANFGSMRLRGPQEDVARYATDLLRLKAQVQWRFFSPETLVQMSGIQNTPDGQNMEAVMQAIQLLKSGTRDFRISIKSDTLAQIDEQAEKAEATEYVTAIGAILESALPVVQAAPPMMGYIGQVLLFASRKYRCGREMESSLEKAIDATIQFMSQPKAPDPSVQVAQIKAQSEQQKAGAEQQRMQGEMVLEGERASNERKELAAEAQMLPLKVQSEQIGAVADIAVAQARLEEAKYKAAHPAPKAKQ